MSVQTFVNGLVEGILFDTDGKGFNLKLYDNHDNEHYDIRFDVVDGVITLTHKKVITDGSNPQT